nr:phage Gp37/Gp68 family protein [Lysobacter alkalisoli]
MKHRPETARENVGGLFFARSTIYCVDRLNSQPKAVIRKCTLTRVLPGFPNVWHPTLDNAGPDPTYSRTLDGEVHVATQSKIEWTDRTWNPTVGCTKISQGCKNCYALVMAERLKAMGVEAYRMGFRLRLLEERLNEPLERKKPTIYFVNSMSDLFHEKIPEAYLDRVFEVIAATPQHQYQILTKRAERMAKYFESRNAPSNAWLGVSVENRKQGVPRIDSLRRVPASIRFLSCEPLLEDLGEIDLTDIHWVIVGGESGAKARPMDASWANSIREQCENQGAAFFFKQWGGWGADGKKRSKSANGRLLEGRTWDQMPAGFNLTA